MPAHQRDDEDELLEDEQKGLFSDVFAIFFFIFIVIISVAVILELKHEYHVDLFKGINTPFDDLYFAVKNTFTGKAPNQTGR
jgi:hypothetical protein